MTSRHLVDGLMRATRCRTFQQCEIRLGIGSSTFSKLYSRKERSVRLTLLHKISQRGEVPMTLMLAWCLQEEGSELEYRAPSEVAEVEAREAAAQQAAAAQIRAAERRIRCLVQAIDALETVMKP